jgi:disulfide oxidoreductase YuzD
MPPLIEPAIQITIVDDSKVEKCDAHCGVDWSSPEVVALASQRIKDRFGDRIIKLQYLDLSKPVTNHYASALKQRVRNNNLPLPLLIINGKPRILGEFDIRLLLDAIDTEIEITP